ncbi:MAG: hypothetical protein IJ468_06815 [Lachnospiraceae bacterium]|nr:hypothetical protein [Lachnospiraceae bacterium]
MQSDESVRSEDILQNYVNKDSRDFFIKMLLMEYLLKPEQKRCTKSEIWNRFPPESHNILYRMGDSLLDKKKLHKNSPVLITWPVHAVRNEKEQNIEQEYNYLYFVDQEHYETYWYAMMQKKFLGRCLFDDMIRLSNTKNQKVSESVEARQGIRLVLESFSQEEEETVIDNMCLYFTIGKIEGINTFKQRLHKIKEEEVKNDPIRVFDAERIIERLMPEEEEIYTILGRAVAWMSYFAHKVSRRKITMRKSDNTVDAFIELISDADFEDYNQEQKEMLLTKIMDDRFAKNESSIPLIECILERKLLIPFTHRYLTEGKWQKNTISSGILVLNQLVSAVNNENKEYLSSGIYYMYVKEKTFANVIDEVTAYMYQNESENRKIIDILLEWKQRAEKDGILGCQIKNQISDETKFKNRLSHARHTKWFLSALYRCLLKMD